MAVNEKLLELAKDLPEEVRDNAVDLVETMGEEIEGIGDEPVTWRPPFLKLIQPTSDTEKLPEGVGPGSLLLGEEIIKPPLRLIPLRRWEARTYFNPDREQGNILCRSPDAKYGIIGQECNSCKFSKYSVELGKSPCRAEMMYMVITADLKYMFYIQFAGSNYQEGKEWKKRLLTAAKEPHRRKYELNIKKNPKQPSAKMYDISGVTGDQRETPSEWLPFLKELVKGINQERKEFLQEFYRQMEEQRKQGTLPKIEDTDETDEAIPGSTGETDQKAIRYQM